MKFTSAYFKCRFIRRKLHIAYVGETYTRRDLRFSSRSIYRTRRLQVVEFVVYGRQPDVEAALAARVFRRLFRRFRLRFPDSRFAFPPRAVRAVRPADTSGARARRPLRRRRRYRVRRSSRQRPVDQRRRVSAGGEKRRNRLRAHLARPSAAEYPAERPLDLFPLQFFGLDNGACATNAPLQLLP